MEAARRIASRLAKEPMLRTRLATVTPIVALLAETVETGALTSEDEDALVALAALDEGSLEDVLYDARDLLSIECAVPLPAREQLLRKLAIYGIRVAVDALRSGADRSAIRHGLREASGFPQLKELIRSVLTRRADPLKADQALTALERLTYQADPAAGARAREQIEDVRLSAPMHRVREIWALGQHAQNLAAELPEWLEARLLRLAEGDTPAERLGIDPDASADAIKGEAFSGVSACRRYANAGATTSQQRRIADTVRRSYELMLVASGPAAADSSSAQHSTSQTAKHFPRPAPSS